MMRANLLPRPSVTLRVLGFECDAEHARRAALGVTIVLAVALLGTAIERMQLHRLEISAVQSELDLALRARERDESKRLALDVARYQEFEREAQSARASGADAAIAIARIGNSVPREVWFDGLDRDAAGYQVSGRSNSFEALGRTILSLGRALPGAGASLVTIDNRDPGSAAHFSAHLQAPSLAGPAQ